MDVVYLCRAGENEELRYSLRSLANLPHEHVWVFGGAPAWLTGATLVPVSQHDVHRYGRVSANKHDVTTRSMRAACEHAGVSDPFILFNDDFYVTERLPCLPMQHRGTVSEVIAYYQAKLGRESAYLRGMQETRDLLIALGIARPLSYEGHWPMEIGKAEMLTALDIGAASGITVLHKRTLYGNLWGVGGRRTEDVKVYQLRQDVPRGPFLSSSDQTFPRLRAHLERLFPEPSRYELPSVTPARQSRQRTRMKGAPMFTVERRVYGTAADGRRVLLFTPGMTITDEAARRAGLLAGEAKPEPPAKGLTIMKPEPADDEPPKRTPLERMTLAQLRALCEVEGIDPQGANTRAEFVAAITLGREEG